MSILSSKGFYLYNGANVVLSTRTDRQHFFGYYDISPFSKDDKFLLAHRVPSDLNRVPQKGDKADIVLISIDDREEYQIGVTGAFNWQQGARLQWLGPDYGSRLIFNDYRDGSYIAVIVEVSSGRESIIPFPVFSVRADGKKAVCMDYHLLHWRRRGYGYAWGEERFKNIKIPTDTGIYIIDLPSGKIDSIISVDRVVRIEFRDDMKDAYHYLENPVYSPYGDKFLFHHRWQIEDGGVFTRLFIAYPESNRLELLVDVGELSHFTWMDNDTILYYGALNYGINKIRIRKNVLAEVVKKMVLPLYRMVFKSECFIERKFILPRRFFVMNVETKERLCLSTAPDYDGHPSFMPGDRNKFLSDTYSHKGYQKLYIYLMDRGLVMDIGKFFVPLEFRRGPQRCDLHPRWNWDGSLICVDSCCIGTRQMYLVDVKECFRYKQ